MSREGTAGEGRFEDRQVWRYRTRAGEEGSRVVVGRVERWERLGVVVHVRLTGLRLANPRIAGGLSGTIDHLPLSEQALGDSVLELTTEPPDLAGFEDGYASWREAFDRGQAGVFSVPLPEVLAFVERGLAGA